MIGSSSINFFGVPARQALSGIAYDRIARLECNRSDRYRRSVRREVVASASTPHDPVTFDAGLAMVMLGMAWWYRAYAHELRLQERGRYAFAEVQARAKHGGLWHDADALPQWEWRVAQRAVRAP